MAFSYTQKRAQQKYADNKLQAPSITSFRHLSKILFVISMLLTLISYWWTFPGFLTFHQSDVLRLIGVILVFSGYFGLNHSFSILDKNYSPLFDAYKPFELVDSGVYAYIRHPVYCFNLCVSFGLAISSGHFLVAISAVTGLLFILRAIVIEEAYLKAEFDSYVEYCARTWRFIPYVF